MTQVNFSTKSAGFFLRLASKVLAKFGAYRVGGRTFQTAGECADHICDKLVRRNPVAVLEPDLYAEVKFCAENHAEVMSGDPDAQRAGECFEEPGPGNDTL